MLAMLDVLGSVNSPGMPGKTGDDRFGFNLGDAAAWVFDGATDVSPLRPFPEVESGAAWVAEAMSQAFMFIPQSDTIARAHLRNVLANVRQRAEAATKIPLDSLTKDAWPVASGIWVKVRGSNAEFNWLGDCMGIIAHGDAAEIIGTVEKAEAETAYHAELMKMTHKDRWEALRIERLEMNESGHPLFGLNPAAADQLNSATHVLKPGTDILLMSDGFYRLVMPYKLHTAYGLMELIRDEGLSGAVAQLRAFESGEDEGPARVKSSDDACAVWLHYGALND